MHGLHSWNIRVKAVILLVHHDMGLFCRLPDYACRTCGRVGLAWKILVVEMSSLGLASV